MKQNSSGEKLEQSIECKTTDKGAEILKHDSKSETKTEGNTNDQK